MGSSLRTIDILRFWCVENGLKFMDFGPGEEVQNQTWLITGFVKGRNIVVAIEGTKILYTPAMKNGSLSIGFVDEIDLADPDSFDKLKVVLDKRGIYGSP